MWKFTAVCLRFHKEAKERGTSFLQLFFFPFLQLFFWELIAACTSSYLALRLHGNRPERRAGALRCGAAATAAAAAAHRGRAEAGQAGDAAHGLLEAAYARSAAGTCVWHRFAVFSPLMCVSCT